MPKIQEIIKIFYKISNRQIEIPQSFEDPFKYQLCTKWCISRKNGNAVETFISLT